MKRHLFGYTLEEVDLADGGFVGAALYHDGQWQCTSFAANSFQLSAIDCCRIMRGQPPVWRYDFTRDEPESAWGYRAFERAKQRFDLKGTNT